jgi:hypothetical protein
MQDNNQKRLKRSYLLTVVAFLVDLLGGDFVATSLDPAFTTILPALPRLPGLVAAFSSVGAGVGFNFLEGDSSTSTVNGLFLVSPFAALPGLLFTILAGLFFTSSPGVFFATFSGLFLATGTTLPGLFFTTLPGLFFTTLLGLFFATSATVLASSPLGLLFLAGDPFAESET